MEVPASTYFKPARLHCTRWKDVCCERIRSRGAVRNPGGGAIALVKSLPRHSPGVRRGRSFVGGFWVVGAVEGKLCGCREIQVSGAGLAIALECGSLFLLSSIASLLEQYHKTSFWS